jgi:hypothetical protein
MTQERFVPDPSLTDAAAPAADYASATTGIVLMTTPLWMHLLATINIVAAAIASVCGAIMGLIGVWRIIRRPKAKP